MGSMAGRFLAGHFETLLVALSIPCVNGQSIGAVMWLVPNMGTIFPCTFVTPGHSSGTRQVTSVTVPPKPFSKSDSSPLVITTV